MKALAKSLYVQVLVAMACGVAVGVATGIGQSRDMKRMGRVGVRALL